MNCLYYYCVLHFEGTSRGATHPVQLIISVVYTSYIEKQTKIPHLPRPCARVVVDTPDMTTYTIPTYDRYGGRLRGWRVAQTSGDLQRRIQYFKFEKKKEIVSIRVNIEVRVRYTPAAT